MQRAPVVGVCGVAYVRDGAKINIHRVPIYVYMHICLVSASVTYGYS